MTLNSEDLGHKPLPSDASPRTWDVPFAAGTIEARCLDHADVFEALHTAGSPANLRMALETASPGTSFDAVAIVRLTVIDSNGNPVPGAAVPITFAVTGPGVLLATDNADTAYTAPFPSAERLTTDGRAVAYVRGADSGTVHLTASTPGLVSASLDLPVSADRKQAESSRKR